MSVRKDVEVIDFKRTRKYNPQRLLKPSGVYTIYLGQESEILPQLLEAYCIKNQHTFSAAIREIVYEHFVTNGFVKEDKFTVKGKNFITKMADEKILQAKIDKKIKEVSAKELARRELTRKKQ